MDFDPQTMTRRLNEIDSLMKIPRTESIIYENVPINDEREEIPVFIADYKSVIMLDPVRLMEGTFYLSYETGLIVAGDFSKVCGQSVRCVRDL